MSIFGKSLVAGAIATTGLAFTAGVSAQPPDWLADEGPLQIIGDVAVDNTGKGGTADDFGCKVRMDGTATGGGDFTIDHVQILNNGWNDAQSFGCHLVTTGDTLPWSGSIDEVSPGEFEVTVTGVFFNAPGQPGCGTDGMNPIPNSSLTGQWRQNWTASNNGFVRSAYSTIVYGNGALDPQTPIEDTDPAGDCLIGGVLNVTRPTGPLVEPAM